MRHIEEAMGEDFPCAVCCKDPADCICPECPKCDAIGDPACYRDSSRKENPTGHGLRLSRAQIISRQEVRLALAKARVQDEVLALNYLNTTADDFSDDLADDVAPWVDFSSLPAKAAARRRGGSR